MLKNILLQWIRKLGWMHGFDRIHFMFNQRRFRARNNKFRKNNPGIILPPAYMLYEAYRLDYEAYYEDGKDTAVWLAQEISAFAPDSGNRILEWGCGPARVVRHLPPLLNDAEIHATDYNSTTIEWCRQHIPGIQFSRNSLSPPLPYPHNFFDVVYALSVFTHLSELHHAIWLNELNRIIRPGGILLLTTQGNAFVSKLSGTEKKQFMGGTPVIRARVEEGHRSFSAFQPAVFMESVFSDRWKVVKFTNGTMQSWGPEQDTWIVEKIN